MSGAGAKWGEEAAMSPIQEGESYPTPTAAGDVLFALFSLPLSGAGSEQGEHGIVSPGGEGEEEGCVLSPAAVTTKESLSGGAILPEGFSNAVSGK